MSTPLSEMNQTRFMDRTITGLVASVDAENGTMQVVYEGLPAGDRATTIPLMWASFGGGYGAWARFIPTKGDWVRLTFDADGTPVVLGYAVKAGDGKLAGGRAGWPIFNRIAKTRTVKSRRPGLDGKVAEQDDLRWLAWRSLKPGEFDFMSGGGAYIYGMASGNLKFKAGGTGTASIELAGSDDSIIYETPLHRLRAGASEMTFGATRRTVAATFVTTSLPWGEEYNLNLRLATPGQPYAVRFAMGHPYVAMNSGGVPTPTPSSFIMGMPGTPVASVWYKFADGDLTGDLPVAGFEIGALGDIGIGGPSFTVMSPSIGLGTVPVDRVTNAVRGGMLYEAVSAANEALRAVIAPLASDPHASAIVTGLNAWTQAVDLALEASLSKSVHVGA